MLSLTMLALMRLQLPKLHLPVRVFTCQVTVRMVCFDFFLTVLLTLQLCSQSESIKPSDRSLWGFLDESIRTVGFSSEEWKLDTKQGTLLRSYPIHGVGSVRKLDDGDNGNTSSFVNIILDKKLQTLNFTLARDLEEFRELHWSASLEISYEIGRQNDPSCTEEYTFMLLIEDCNLRAPKFQAIDEIPIYLPWPDDDELPMTKTKSILVTDGDINFQYANVTVTCIEINGSLPCDNFRIEQLKEVNETDEGYEHSVKIYLLENSTLNRLDGNNFKSGENFTFTIGLLASDSEPEHDATTIVTFIATPYMGSQSSNESKFPIAPVVGIASLLLVLGAAGFGYTTWRNRQTKNILRKLTEQEIREFLEGTAGFGEGVAKRSIDCNTPILAQPYNRAFEIPRDRLRIDETTILGSGFFGVVMRGSVQHENGESTTVAVKAVKRNVGVLYFKALLSELKIMAHIGKHNNIVSLIGACTHNIRKREVFIAVEFCENGNLHNYLRTHRSGFTNMVEDGKLCAVSESFVFKRKGSGAPPMSTLDLLRWSMQIAAGLDYLGSLGIIHGDLATRNVLLDSNRLCKIADFGLSRRLVDVSSYYYTKQSQAPLPWKWMSIESLKDAKFSKKSDIWSFGVTLWEIFTLGTTPFGGLNWDETFVDRLESGLRLTHPPFATEAIYDIMRDCWEADPHHRPAIFDVKRLLEGMSNILLEQAHDDDGYFKVLGADSKIEYEKDSLETLPRSLPVKQYADYRVEENAEC